jgi:hypothetical protein
MSSKLTIALAAAAMLGATALVPSTAAAHWHGYKYGWPGYSQPYYGYGPGYHGYRWYGHPRFFPRWHYSGWRRFGYY